MSKSTPAIATSLREQLDRLASFEPQELPVLSLYLNLTAFSHGRDSYDSFLRKVLAERQRAFEEDTAERESFDEDAARIHDYLSSQVTPSMNGVAIFCCSGAEGFFEGISLQVPVGDHALYVGATPHVYPLARLVDQYPRYAAVVLDTNRARIIVFGLGAVERREKVVSDRMRRTDMGGWSQARYQRRADHWHLLHVKDVVSVLDRVVTDERIAHIVVAGDEVVVPILKEQLPQRLIDKLVDVLALDQHVPEDKLLQSTLEVLRAKDAETDVARVQEVVGAWQASGLGVVGPEAAFHALALGQVDELLVAGTPEAIRVAPLPPDTAEGGVGVYTSAPGGAPDGARLQLADELVRRAGQTAASVRFIEDASLLEPYGGVAASLRFRV